LYEPAVVVSRSDTALFTVPERVRAGEQFVVAFTVFADGCTRDKPPTEVQVHGRTAEIRPLMRRETSEPCPAVLRILRESVAVRFDTPGEGVVRVIGSRQGPPTDSAGRRYTRPAVLERRIPILPVSR
jgi:hypothetical protein